MNSRIVKSTKTGDVYEVQYVVHPAEHAPAGTTDVYACYRLSNYDGLPIGSLVWLSGSELEPADAERLTTMDLERPLSGRRNPPNIG